MSRDQEWRIPAILTDISRFAATAKRVVSRGWATFSDPDNDDQRRIARSLVVDLSTAASRLPQSFRELHPSIDWPGIRATRNLIAHDYDGTDEAVLWRALTTEFPKVVQELGLDK